MIGPKRSGSECHQDPLGTSAWNTSIQGRKRWLLIPPEAHIDKHMARGKKYEKDDEDNEAIHYFDLTLPRMMKAEGPTGTNKM